MPSVLAVNTTTIDDIANWAAVKKLKRFDLLPNARESALDFYRLLCQKVPFDSLRTAASLSFTAGIASYDIQAMLAAVSYPVLAGIASIGVNTGFSRRRLRRSHIRVFDALNILTTGIPSVYARWGGYIGFNPTPSSSSYSFYFHYWTRPEINSVHPELTILQTPPEWDELLKWETYYRMLIDLDQFEKAQQLVAPVGLMGGQRQRSVKHTIMFETAIIPRLWNDLLQTIDQREGVDEDFSINPTIRRYTRVS